MARNLRLIESLWRYGVGGYLARFGCNLTRSVYFKVRQLNECAHCDLPRGEQRCFSYVPTASAVTATCRPNHKRHSFVPLSAPFVVHAPRQSLKAGAQIAEVS